MDEIGFTRRWMLEGGAVGAGLAAWPAAAGPMPAGRDYDPRQSSAGQVKLDAYADGRAAPWWYTGTIYAVRERTKPKALFRFEGCETYWASPKSSGEADVYSRTLTFFRDLDTNAWLDTYDNASTGRRDTVRPNLFGGQVVYPADGSPPHAKALPQGVSQIAPQGLDPDALTKPMGSFRWVVSGPMVLRIGDRALPSRLQPSMEAQSTFCDSKAFFDPRVQTMAAQFSSTTFSPYLGWMTMPDEPGHLVWHASGYKLAGFSQLPPEFLARAESFRAGALTAPPG